MVQGREEKDVCAQRARTRERASISIATVMIQCDVCVWTAILKERHDRLASKRAQEEDEEDAPGNSDSTVAAMRASRSAGSETSSEKQRSFAKQNEMALV